MGSFQIPKPSQTIQAAQQIWIDPAAVAVVQAHHLDGTHLESCRKFRAEKMMRK